MAREIQNRALASRSQCAAAEIRTTGRLVSAGWITALTLFFTTIGGMVLFFYKTVPEVRKIKEEVAGINATRQNELAQAKVADLTAREMQDPVRKAASELARRTAQFEFAKAADELLDVNTPNLRAETNQAWGDIGHLIIPIALKNDGTRGIWLSNLRIDIKFIMDVGAAQPNYVIQKCSLGYVPPGGYIPCHLDIRVADTESDFERMDYTYRIDAKPYQVDDSQSYKLLQTAYPREVIDKRLFLSWKFTGTYIEE